MEFVLVDNETFLHCGTDFKWRDKGDLGCPCLQFFVCVERVVIYVFLRRALAARVLPLFFRGVPNFNYSATCVTYRLFWVRRFFFGVGWVYFRNVIFPMGA